MTNKCRSETRKCVSDIDREIADTFLTIQIVTEKITRNLSQRKGDGPYGKRQRTMCSCR